MEEITLVEMYREALVDIEPRFLTIGDKEGLSGLFLPSMPQGYATAKNKVMVVGRETRTWKVSLPTDDQSFFHGYVDAAMDTHRKHLLGEWGKTNSRGRSFFNFVRDVKPRQGWKDLFIPIYCVTRGKEKVLLTALI
ncbi:hypothetical protein [Halopseudomonas sabulinigri]|uniref:hypothetical protein n=1 Tax=Halopseudomonas sabulinigri TaxID=472181 RepID=UPI000B88A9B0|nr:hypothetical protein [Halopseudomonas sabulinigri]